MGDVAEWLPIIGALDGGQQTGDMFLFESRGMRPAFLVAVCSEGVAHCWVNDDETEVRPDEGGLLREWVVSFIAIEASFRMTDNPRLVWNMAFFGRSIRKVKEKLEKDLGCALSFRGIRSVIQGEIGAAPLRSARNQRRHHPRKAYAAQNVKVYIDFLFCLNVEARCETAS